MCQLGKVMGLYLMGNKDKRKAYMSLYLDN